MTALSRVITLTLSASLLGGCRSHHRADPDVVPAPAPHSPRDAAPLADASPTPAPTPATDASVADAGEPPMAALEHARVVGGCFAWSASLHALACVTYDLSIQNGGNVAVRSVGGDGDGGDDDRVFTVYAREGYGTSRPDDPDEFNAPERRRATDYLRAAGFAAWDPPAWLPITPGVFTRLAGLTFRHRRRMSYAGADNVPPQFDDHVEIHCGHRWVALDLLQSHPELSESTAQVALLPDGRVALVVAHIWGEEGDNGSEFEASVLDPRRVCAEPSDAGASGGDAAARPAVAR